MDKFKHVRGETVKDSERNNMERRDFLRLSSGALLAIAGGGVLSGCGGGKGNGLNLGGSGGSQPQQPLTALLFSNPADPSLARISDTSGRNALFIGAKNAQGFPTTLLAAIVDSDDRAASKRAHILYDGASRPQSVILADGSSLKLEYVSASQIRLTLTGADGVVRGPVIYNPQTKKVVLAPAAALSSGRMQAVPTPRVSSDAIGTVTVTSGGVPISEALVSGFYRPGRLPAELPSGYTHGFLGRAITPNLGKYEYSVPRILFTFPDTPAAHVQKFIDSLQDRLSDACDVITGGPAGIGLGLTPAAVTLLAAQIGAFFGPLAPAVSATIAAAGGALLFTCTAHDLLKVEQLTTKLIDIASVAASGSGQISVTAVFPGQIAQTKTAQATPSTGVLPAFSFAFPGNIHHIDIAPSNPTVEVGKTTVLTATARDKNNAVVVVPASNFQWSSSDTSIATVSGGSVSGLKAGRVTVTVKEVKSGKTDNVLLSVVATKVVNATLRMKFLGSSAKPGTPDFTGTYFPIFRVTVGSQRFAWDTEKIGHNPIFYNVKFREGDTVTIQVIRYPFKNPGDTKTIGGSGGIEDACLSFDGDTQKGFFWEGAGPNISLVSPPVKLRARGCE